MIFFATGEGGAGGSITPILLMVVGFLLIYMLMMRPQRKQYKELEARRGAMKKGDRVITAGGFHGKIFAVKDTYVVIEVLPDNVKMRINKASIAEVQLKEVPERISDVDDDNKTKKNRMNRAKYKKEEKGTEDFIREDSIDDSQD